MPTAKKPAAKKPAEKKEPTPTQVEGFTTEDYEDLESFVCERPKCGFQTFNAEAADAHRDEHEADDDATAFLESLTEHLDEHAQVTTEEPTDDA